MGYFDNYNFRCSSLGNIVTKSGKNTKELTSYLHEIFVQEIYGEKKNISNKYFDKGKFCEEDGISMLQKVFYQNKLIIKNRERKQNEFINGECDIEMDDWITDIKNAWDISTLIKSELTHEYKCQLIGYCWLWNKKNGRLFYTLNTMPEFMIEEEKKKLFYYNKYYYVNMESDNYINDVKLLEQTFTFDNLPLECRFKFWEFNVTDSDFDMIKDAVIRARDILNNMYDDCVQTLSMNKKLIN